MNNNIWDMVSLEFNDNNEILNITVLQYDINELILKLECDIGGYILKCKPLYFSFGYASVVRDRDVVTDKEGVLNHEWAIGKMFVLHKSSKVQELVRESCDTLSENELIHYVICVEDGDVDIVCHILNKLKIFAVQQVVC